ncbi:MAG: substrate-binding domain-containing protein, partial [Candidatus Thermoplasmatota archaeon]
MGKIKSKKIDKIALAIIITTILSVGLLSGCTENKKTVTIKGSTTVLPVAESCAEEFMKQNKNIKVIVTGGGSSLGIKSVANGEADIGDASREV